MKLSRLRSLLPSLKNAGLAVCSALLLAAAFPNFEYWFAAWFAFLPLLWALDRQKASTTASFLIGWLFGTVFFFSTCWWLTYAPIHYAGIPWPIAYALILIACIGAGFFPGAFAAILSVLLRRVGDLALLAVPFVWVATEYMRYWMTGNDWNAVGYSQAFAFPVQQIARIGGVLMVSFVCVLFNSAVYAIAAKRSVEAAAAVLAAPLLICIAVAIVFIAGAGQTTIIPETTANVIAVQPNVPMAGLDSRKWETLRTRQIELAQAEIDKLRSLGRTESTLVILPESPMNFMYADDREFQQFVRDFTTGNNVSLLFNSAEPDATNGKYFNSAVMVGADGREAAQYDKIYLLPFGEAVPVPFESIVPAFVGSFSYGREYDLLPVGDAKAGIMICFESHFGALSRQFVNDGADLLIEMTNDGYLGPTPVLRQHLANAVFRAVETNRPVMRVTNVGVTAYIDELGEVFDAAAPYTEAVRVWPAVRSNGSKTLYVRFGDWFAWLCALVTIISVVIAVRRRGGPQKNPRPL